MCCSVKKQMMILHFKINRSDLRLKDWSHFILCKPFIWTWIKLIWSVSDLCWSGTAEQRRDKASSLWSESWTTATVSWTSVSGRTGVLNVPRSSLMIGVTLAARQGRARHYSKNVWGILTHKTTTEEESASGVTRTLTSPLDSRTDDWTWTWDPGLCNWVWWLAALQLKDRFFLHMDFLLSHVL